VTSEGEDLAWLNLNTGKRGNSKRERLNKRGGYTCNPVVRSRVGGQRNLDALPQTEGISPGVTQVSESGGGGISQVGTSGKEGRM